MFNMERDNDNEIWVGDYLPTVYEVTLTIPYHGKTYGSQKRQTVIHKYSSAVRMLWVKRFSESHVVSPTIVKRQVEQILEDYQKRVIRASEIKKHLTLRCGNKLWIDMDVP